MRSTLIGSVTGAFLLFFSTLAFADPPPGVGAAMTESGFACFYSVVVGPSEDGDTFTPFLPDEFGNLTFGQIITPTVENTKFVVTNSANGNLNLTCHGQIEFGSMVTGIDGFTLLPDPEDWVEGRIPEDLGPACDAIAEVLPGACRGNGAVVLNGNQQDVPCQIIPGVFTLDWRQIVTPSGRVTLSCHYPE